RLLTTAMSGEGEKYFHSRGCVAQYLARDRSSAKFQEFDGCVGPVNQNEHAKLLHNLHPGELCLHDPDQREEEDEEEGRKKRGEE
ncbi:hypothetical protein KUCAC02_025780, partial [Chaenocephalus aceratus]